MQGRHDHFQEVVVQLRRRPTFRRWLHQALPYFALAAGLAFAGVIGFGFR